MARSTQWRRNCNDLVYWRQCEALNATIYILRETGPTGFLLKEDGESKTHKVFLGDPHKCSCPQFKKDKDLCKHICWLILKKFRIPQENAMTWQLGLVEREINDILRGLTLQQQHRRQTQSTRHKRAFSSSSVGDGRQTIQQREIGENDVCPICQDELLAKHLPVTYCKFGCGNSIHIKCMKIWADHQKTSGDSVIKCPFCREDFGPIELLNQENRNAGGPVQGGRMDRHLGTNCQSCHTSPIEGKCYRCTSCVDFHLCQSCFNTPIHTQHSFEYRHKRNQRWRIAQRTYGAVLPQAVVDDLLNRELSESDYDLLTQLDSNVSAPKSDIPESVVQSFPLEKIREGSSSLLAPGIQCRICLRGYEIGQLVRKLPRCKHKFHKDCIDNWLLHSHPTCPIDGNVVWHPNMEEQDEDEEDQRNRVSRPPRKDNSVQQSRTLNLEIPGIGIARQSEGSNNQTSTTTANINRRLGILRQMRNNQQTDSEALRASFALSGTALGYGNDGSGETTQASDLPGSRLLARTQLRRSNLTQQLMNNGEVEENNANRSAFSQLNQGAINSHTAGNGLELQGNSVLPFDLCLVSQDQTGSSATQNTIRNHLSHLLVDSESDNSDDRGNVNSHRYHSLRNALLSSTEIRSPLRELAPVLESDQENVTVDRANEEHVPTNDVGIAGDISHQTFFQRHPTLRFQSENEDNISLSSSVASSAFPTPVPYSIEDMNKGIPRNSNTAITPPPEQGSHRNNREGTASVSSAPSVLVRSHLSNENQVKKKQKENSAQRSATVQNENQRVVVPTRDQPLSIDTNNIMDRLQMFTDLYLGNDPRQQGATNENPRTQTRLPPRPPRRQISDHIAATARRRAQMRRRRRDDISLEGTTAYSNMTFRDILH